MLYLVLAALSQASGASTTQPQTVFGLEFGKPLEIRVCEKVNRRNLEPTEGVCKFEYVGEAAKSTPGVSNAGILFAESEQPQIVVGSVVATLINGRLEGVEFTTAGSVAVRFVMDALREKYGKPASIDKYQMTNGLGITTDHLSAEWSKGSVKVSYVELLPGSRVGKVTIETTAGLKNRAAGFVHPKDQGTKL